MTFWKWRVLQVESGGWEGIARAHEEIHEALRLYRQQG